MREKFYIRFSRDPGDWNRMSVGVVRPSNVLAVCDREDADNGGTLAREAGEHFVQKARLGDHFQAGEDIFIRIGGRFCFG
jgi:hypothetical protein